MKTEPLKNRIITLNDNDLQWGYENGNSRVHYKLKTPNSSWPHIHYVDPFPCYSMNRDIVEQIAEKAEAAFPVPFKPYYFILAHEFDDRCNGMATTNHIYIDDANADRPMPFDSVIVFSGKRIPIHPGMQRYLVAHEYGHIVDYNITYMRKKEIDGLDEEYAQMRGLELNQKYTARNWHANIGEILVNDFRIVCTDTESEYWPHDVAPPAKLDAVTEQGWRNPVKEFWNKMKTEYARDDFPLWMKEILH